MPRRPEPLPIYDRLLVASQCARMLGMSTHRWWGYYARFATLLRGRRVVTAVEGTKGRFRWLRSAIVEHMHLDLPSYRADVEAEAKAPVAAGA